MLGGFIALVVLAGVMFGAGRGFALILAHDYTPDDPLVKNVRRYTALAAALMMGGAALLTLFASVHRVEAGHAGLVRRFGAVTGRHVEPGLNMTWPFAEDLVIYRLRDGRGIADPAHHHPEAVGADAGKIVFPVEEV